MKDEIEKILKDTAPMITGAISLFILDRIAWLTQLESLAVFTVVYALTLAVGLGVFMTVSTMFSVWELFKKEDAKSED